MSLKENQLRKAMGTSVIITHIEDVSNESLPTKSINKEKVLQIQQAVCQGQLIPQY